jgi:Family of unknown function (DUF5631)/Family of unknown function (DUF5632)
VAIFGRNTARQRLRRATRESLKIPAFSSPVDCAPWVTGGLWPAELSTVTADTAPLVKYLKADLQKIVNSANEELSGIRRAGLADPTRQAEEARVIKDARAFAVRRVESTVRHLRNMTQKLPAEHRPVKPVNGADDTEKTRRFTAVAIAQTDINGPTDGSARPGPEHPEQGRCQAAVVDQHDSRTEPVDAPEEPTPAAEPETGGPKRLAPTYPSDPDDTEVLEGITTVLQEIATISEAPFDGPPWQPSTARHAEAPVDEAVTEVPPAGHTEPPVDEGPAEVTTAPYQEPPVYEAAAEELPAARHVEPPGDEAAIEEPPAVRRAEPPIDQAPIERHVEAPVETESDVERLERLLQFVARQEPRVCWAVGDREDGTTVVVMDLAHGWIPPDIALPAGVRLLEPALRTGNVAALLGPTTLSATYAPGDSLGWATDFDPTESSLQPRELPAVEDLGGALSEATYGHDGLPRMVHTLAEAGAAGTGAVDVGIVVLRVHLETARYQLVAQYPDVDAALLLNCLLLAATEAIATGDRLSANYHFTWFQMLSAPRARRWLVNG